MISENEKASYLDRITLADFQIVELIEADRMNTGAVTGICTTTIRIGGLDFAFRQNRVGSNTLHVKRIG